MMAMVMVMVIAVLMIVSGDACDDGHGGDVDSEWVMTDGGDVDSEGRWCW